MEIGTKIAPDPVPVVGASLVGARWCGVGQRSKTHGEHIAETHFHTLGRRPQPAWVIPLKIPRPAPHRITRERTSPRTTSTAALTPHSSSPRTGRVQRRWRDLAAPALLSLSPRTRSIVTPYPFFVSPHLDAGPVPMVLRLVVPGKPGTHGAGLGTVDVYTTQPASPIFMSAGAGGNCHGGFVGTLNSAGAVTLGPAPHNPLARRHSCIG